MTTPLATDDRLADVLAELTAREPIFHHPELGVSRGDFEAMTDERFSEVGASGRCYSRDFVTESLVERYSSPHDDVWEAGGFVCRELAPNTYLMTYRLVQDGARITRRSTIWRREAEKWKILYHQGTIVTAEVEGRDA